MTACLCVCLVVFTACECQRQAGRCVGRLGLCCWAAVCMIHEGVCCRNGCRLQAVLWVDVGPVPTASYASCTDC